jgi:hypothetical protein
MGKFGERKIVYELYKEFERNKKKGELPQLVKIRRHLNLVNKEYKDIYRPWWQDQVPPRIEVDLVFILKEQKPRFERAFLAGIEVKYFDSPSRRFFEGIQQALSYGLLGFDGLSLWHIFAVNIPDEKIRLRADTTAKIIHDFNLPIFYVAFKVISISEVSVFSPKKLQGSLVTSNLVTELYKHFSEDEKKRNPLLSDHLAQKSRNVLKAMFKIPFQ